PQLFFFKCCAAHRALHSFPTRRSSDLKSEQVSLLKSAERNFLREEVVLNPFSDDIRALVSLVYHRFNYAVRLRFDDNILESEPKDRKSTRLNSSHVKISYAVFCLKKKK